MQTFGDIDIKQFLAEYWQKKPLLIKNALPHFNAPLTGDELAGLALDQDIESRLVTRTNDAWSLRRGPFTEKDFAKLPKRNWTLLVQGVDRLVPEVASLWESFRFIPGWRIDDIMISIAGKDGGVGPHFDHYDVFLFQASGSRQWALTTQDCNIENYRHDCELRIMKQFKTEITYTLEPGDMLYLPPFVGHDGIALSDDCITYSFGYRSYRTAELIDHLSGFLEENQYPGLLQDPDWRQLMGSSEISDEVVAAARNCMLTLIEDNTLLKRWFATFATQLDQNAEQLLPIPLATDALPTLEIFKTMLLQSKTIVRDSICRMAYTKTHDGVSLYINGTEWEKGSASNELICMLACETRFDVTIVAPLLQNESNLKLLYDLWHLRWLQFED